MVQETAKLLVKDIKDSLLVPATRNRDSREVRCLYTDVFLREVKILGNGELTKKLNVKVNAVSETAKTKIEAAGGTVEVI